MSNLLGALSSAMPLIRWGGGRLLEKARPFASKAMNWLIPKFGGDVNTGVGRSVKDWFLGKLDNTFGGIMDWADSYVAKNKTPIVAKTQDGIASAIQERLRGGASGGTGGGGGTDMEGIERINTSSAQ